MRKTKWVALAVAAVMAAATVVVAQSGFPDVPDDHPHRAAIDWSRDVGAFQGYPDGTFRPDQKITAEQAAIVFGRVYPDGVSRAEFAALLYVGRDLLSEETAPTTTTTVATTTTTTRTVTTTTTQLWSTGAWVKHEFSGLDGDGELFYLVASSHSGYDWESPPQLVLRCGVDSSGYDAAFVLTPFLLFGDDDDEVWVRYRTEAMDSPRSEWWWSNEDIDSALWPPLPNQLVGDLREAGEGAVYFSVVDDHDDTETWTFDDIFGVRGALQRLSCWD